MGYFDNNELNSMMETIMKQSDADVREAMLQELHDNYLNDVFLGVNQAEERRIIRCFVYECDDNGNFFNIACLIIDVLKKYTDKHGFYNLMMNEEDRTLMQDIALDLMLGCKYAEGISLYKKLIYNENTSEDELKYALKWMHFFSDEPETASYLSKKEYDLFRKYC